MRNVLVTGIFFSICMLHTSMALAKAALHFSGAHGHPVDVRDYAYSVPSTQHFAINLSFEKADAEHLKKLMNANKGSQISVKIGDQAILLPIVREAIENFHLQLTLSDQKSFDSAKAALSNSAG